MSPRPILKRTSDDEPSPTASALPFASCSKLYVYDSPHVHFPPPPSLTSTGSTHSSSVYDRAPIVVTPNVCALPERGGRVYTPQSPPPSRPSKRASSSRSGCYFHPRAYGSADELSTRSSLPPLIFDSSSPSSSPSTSPYSSMSSSDSSESDDSDGCATESPSSSQPSSPLVSNPDDSHEPHNPHTGYPPLPRTRSQEEIENALSFLPHAPTPVREKERMPKPKKSTSSRRASESDVDSRLSRISAYRSRRIIGFQEPFLEGCLGGF